MDQPRSTDHERRLDPEGRRQAIDERMRSKDATALEKGLAVVAGAAEGFAEQSRDLPALAGEAVDKVTETVRGVRDAVRGEAAARTRSEDASAFPGFERPSAPGLDTGAPADAPPFPTGAAQAVPTPRERAAAVADRVQRTSAAVAESARRAAEAPAALRHEMRATVKAVARDAAGAAVGFLAGAFFAMVAWVAAVVGFALGINARYGDNRGWWIAAIGHLVLAAAVGLVGYSAARKAPRDLSDGLADMKDEVREVVAPLRGMRAGR